MKTHRLKCWPQFYGPLKIKFKTFEIRRNDRDFQIGDQLIIEEFDPISETYTGQRLGRWVSYVTDFAQQPDYVVLGLTPGTFSFSAEEMAALERLASLPPPISLSVLKAAGDQLIAFGGQEKA